jgi:hypothetical protein
VRLLPALQIFALLLGKFEERVYPEVRFMLFTLTTRVANPANQPVGQGMHAIMGSG